MRELLALVPYRGVIRERSVEPFVRLLKALRTKRRVKGVVLDISSGGGEQIASVDFYLAVKRLDQVKPVFASIGSIGASGAYLAALGARRIFAYPDSSVGSIGVVFPHIALRELFNRLGVNLELLHAGRHKDAYQGYRPLTEEERTKLTAVIEHGYESFVQTVARERKRPLEEIRALATGEFWSGSQALKLGLIDALADREMVVEELAKLTGVPARKTARVTPPRPLLERVFSGGTSVLGSGLARGVRETIEDAIYDVGLRGRL